MTADQPFTLVDMLDARSRHVFERFIDVTLPKSQWDHGAHLTVCWVALDRLDPADALTLLRDAISRYNVATGVANIETAGYHETLTRYFGRAVADSAASTVDDVFESEPCARDAPLRHWTRERLFSRTARARWMEPDLVELPWDGLGLVNGESPGLAPQQHA